MNSALIDWLLLQTDQLTLDWLLPFNFAGWSTIAHDVSSRWSYVPIIQVNLVGHSIDEDMIVHTCHRISYSHFLYQTCFGRLKSDHSLFPLADNSLSSFSLSLNSWSSKTRLGLRWAFRYHMDYILFALKNFSFAWLAPFFFLDRKNIL